MIIKKEKKKFFCLVLLIVLLSVLGNVSTGETSRRLIKAAEFKPITSRRVEFNDKFFNIYINHSEKFITVHGIVDDWKEMNKVEDYFKIRAPFDYHIAYNIKLWNNN